MLAAALRRHARHGALEDLEQRLLHAFAAHVARDARVLTLARDLVDLVDVHDAALALGDVEIAGLQQPHQDVLDVLADVPGFGERRGVGDRERHVENARQRLCQQRLAHARGAESKMFDLSSSTSSSRFDALIDALVVVVHRDGERFLGLLLPDHVLVQDVLDFLRRRDLRDRFRYLALFILRQDLVAERDALVADVDRRARNELPDRILGLSAEGAAQVLVVGHVYPGSRRREVSNIPSEDGQPGGAPQSRSVLVNHFTK